MAFSFNPFTGNFDKLVDVYSVVSVAVNTSALAGKTYLVDCSAAVRTITLPAPTPNASVRVKDSTGSSSTNTITIDTVGAETIDGAASQTITSDYGSLTFVSDGTNWSTL